MSEYEARAAKCVSEALFDLQNAAVTLRVIERNVGPDVVRAKADEIMAEINAIRATLARVLRPDNKAA